MSMLPFKKIFTAMALAGAVMASPVSHAAALINSTFNPGAINTVQDSDADRILRLNTAGQYVAATGDFQVGDVFQSILRFDTVNSNAINGAVGTLSYGLWAYSAVKIDSINSVNPDGSLNISFGASGLFSDPGVMIELFEANSGTNFLGQLPDTGIANVNGLTKIAEFGKVNPLDFWFATIPSAISALSQPLGSGQQPSGIFGLSLLTNAGNLPIQDNAMTSLFAAGHPLDGSLFDGSKHDIIGDASAFPRETGTNTGWAVSTNTNVSFYVVPEPSSLALLGLGALLLANSSKRRHSI